MKMLRGLFVLGLVVTGLILSRAGRAQEIPVSGGEILNVITGKIVCVGLPGYLSVAGSPAFEEIANQTGCSFVGGAVGG